MVSIGVVGAVVAGVLSLLSPCSALLLPAFFAYAFSSRRLLIARTLMFFCGLASVLVPIGIGVGWVGSLVAVHRQWLISGSGALMILLGTLMVLGKGFSIPGLTTLSSQVRGTSWFAVWLLGAVYGVAGLCAGPMLGAVLTTALTSSSVIKGGAVMASYAFGMAVPLFILAALWDSYDFGSARWLQGRWPGRLGGALFIAMGISFLVTRGTASLSGPLSADRQLELQQRALTATAGLSTPTAILLVLISALVAVLGLTWLKRESILNESKEN